MHRVCPHLVGKLTRLLLNLQALKSLFFFGPNHRKWALFKPQNLLIGSGWFSEGVDVGIRWFCDVPLWKFARRYTFVSTSHWRKHWSFFQLCQNLYLPMRNLLAHEIATNVALVEINSCHIFYWFSRPLNFRKVWLFNVGKIVVKYCFG